ncbi:hypothetical protein ACFTXM_26320 [Streptomyces sp. NPDC056930]|uniref:hypothetical protein n=1 Tax=Streptomyces sp. NPDC056930 TaxID=3345967 RepID=UPI00362C72AF
MALDLDVRPPPAGRRAASRAPLPDAAGFPAERLRVRTAQDPAARGARDGRRLLRESGLHRRPAG